MSKTPRVSCLIITGFHNDHHTIIHESGPLIIKNFNEDFKKFFFFCFAYSVTPLYRTHSYQLSSKNGDENHTSKRPKVDSSLALSPSPCDINDMDRMRRQVGKW